MNRLASVIPLLLPLAALAVGCRAGTSNAPPATDDTASTDDTGHSGTAKRNDASVKAKSACSIEKTRTLSESCCEDYGIDACGAGLFCAAYDGRTQSTCYALHSRDDKTECSTDHQCMSGECSATVGKCKSRAYALGCEVAIGCAATNTGSLQSCVNGSCETR